MKVLKFIEKNSESDDSTDTITTAATSISTEVQQVPTSSKITREVTLILHAARMFVPRFFQRKPFLVYYTLLPLIDFVTDYFNAGIVLFQRLVTCTRTY